MSKLRLNVIFLTDILPQPKLAKLLDLLGEVMSDSDLLFGADEPVINEKAEHPSWSGKKWRLLIVDDEDQVHKVTSLVLNRCRFDHAPVELVHAYSMSEAQKILSEQAPFALALVDVVMETDDAGLRLVRYIREELKDKDIRLVLRTGQPGQAPEETVIAKYDINDYKNKTELTSTKLKTLLYSTLRSYRDIRAIAANRQGLYNLIEATSKIVDARKLPIFASAVLAEVGTLLNLDEDAVCAHMPVDAVAAQANHHKYSILAATGKIKERLDNNQSLPDEIVQYFDKAKHSHQSLCEESVYIGYYKTPLVGENLLYVKPNATLDKMGSHLLDIYTRCVAITHHNLSQKSKIQDSRTDLVYVLSETIEQRSPSDSHHVRHVSEMAYALAKKAGLNEYTCERIKLAAPLHDIGTIGISDKLLVKPGLFDTKERTAMRLHTDIGATILGKSQRPILKMACIIAAQHHEHWDGQGQPKQLKGEGIDIAARIVCIVDAIDSLGRHKSYRAAFSPEEIVKHIIQESGKQFDPTLAVLALELMDEFEQIKLPQSKHK
jgi:response regulator RpfG family c-di-GMP phosphodiesterase